MKYILAVMIMFAAWPAMAQTPFKPRSPIDPLAKLMNDVASVKAEVVVGVIGDITAADADAATLTNPADPTSFRDPISHACYPQQIKYLQSLPVATPPTGKFIVVQLFQKKRDFIIQLKAGLPPYLRIGCGALLGDEIKILISTLGMVGVTIASGGLGGILPALGTLPTLPLFGGV